MIKATNRHTGEVVELPTGSPEEIIQAWQIAQEYEKVSKYLKDQLKELVPQFVPDGTGTSQEYNGYQFRISSVQRMSYDKFTVLNEVKDQDLLFDMLKPDKSFIDNWLKDNVETSGELGTKLRKSMIADGKPYKVIKLEKLTKE